MAWNAAVPAVGDYANNFPAAQVANNQAVEAAISAEHQFPNTGYDGVHKFPVVGSTPASYEGRLAIVNDALFWYSNGAWHGSFESGVSMLFCQATAPLGWTQDVSQNDRVIRVVSTSGGGTGGDWDFTGVTVQGHTLLVSEIPAHTHTYAAPDSVLVAAGSLGVAGSQSGTTGSIGGSAAHTHPGLTNPSWRPAYLDSIICAKD